MAATVVALALLVGAGVAAVEIIAALAAGSGWFPAMSVTRWAAGTSWDSVVWRLGVGRRGRLRSLASAARGPARPRPGPAAA